MRRTLSAALGLLLTGSFALAGTPLGGDDGGFIAPDKTTLKCEDGVGKAASKLAGAVFKCQIKQADSSLKLGSSQDDDACEATAIGKYNATVGKLTGCPPCLNPGAIRDNTVSQINGLANGALYCAGSTPFGGDDMGNIPPDKTTAKCEDTAVKAVSKLTGAIAKCHAKQADTSFKLGSSQDDDTCETAAGTKFTAATSKLTAAACPAAGCLITLLPTIGGLAEPMIDGMNGATYCASPSGAFLR
jgi:hypothetical protein